MSGICDRCNERSSQIANITTVVELASLAHLGYRNVCNFCYDDLLAEASEIEENDDDRRNELRVKVSLKARIEGNTSHLDPFSEEMLIEEISPSGLRLHTGRSLEPGSLLKVVVPSHNVETAALVEVVWSDSGQRSVGLKLVDPSDEWLDLWDDYAPGE